MTDQPDPDQPSPDQPDPDQPSRDQPAAERDRTGRTGAEQPARREPFAMDGGPWAMQLAIRDDRPDRPGHLAVCAAAGEAVVRLLTDPRSVDGRWTPYVRHWMDGRIRKVVRRGRGATFAATGVLEHVEVDRKGTVVRAFVPGPTDAVPRELSRLQVAGTDLPRDGDISPGGEGLLVTVALNPLAAMTTGKAAAQTGHAAQLAWMALQPPELAPVLDRWRAQEFAVRVVLPGEREWRRWLGNAPVTVRDAGFTEVEPGTLTAVAAWDG
ncbi:MAG TPA: peptidyl-tRNA hydrolase [Kineosporiaceae bacterium]|nr:peptidyl-tRNA hydrolase [Kineosporiaceae bacterium]